MSEYEFTLTFVLPIVVADIDEAVERLGAAGGARDDDRLLLDLKAEPAAEPHPECDYRCAASQRAVLRSACGRGRGEGMRLPAHSGAARDAGASPQPCGPTRAAPCWPPPPLQGGRRA